MRALAALALAAVLLTGPAAAALRYVATPRAVPDATVVDARDGDNCPRRSLAAGGGGAVLCLPPRALLGPQGRLLAPRALLWRLGTLGLTGAEAVLVVGDAPEGRDFIAGVLHLAGQAEVAVLDRPLTPLLAAGAATAAGMTASSVRLAVYAAPARDHRLLRRDEVAARLRRGGVLLLDGRDEEAFWGATVLAARGGRLPGAQSLPAALLRQARGAEVPPVLAPPPGREAIVYAADARAGIAYYTLLVAGFGVDARAYAGGWAEWAASPLPADGASFPRAQKRGG